MTSDLFDAASSGSDDEVVFLEVLHEEVFGGSGVDLVAAVGHGLAAAGLVQGVAHVQPQSLQELQSGHPNLRKDHVDVAGYKETDLHVLRYHPLICSFGLCRHFYFSFGFVMTQAPLNCGLDLDPMLRLIQAAAMPT